ncbi:MAG: Holliday junction branch migration protein RuvA [Actinomycetota bacterium]
MIAKLWGKITEKQPSYVILRCGEVGFEVLISARTYERLPGPGEGAELDIYTHVREDGISLVGFNSLKEKLIFLKLLDVSGVSVKIALSAFSVYDHEQLKDIIVKKEVDLLKRVPGIGKKLAERIVLELSEKFGAREGIGPVLAEDNRIAEVRQALKSLGYSVNEIEKALRHIDVEHIEGRKTEDILKLALKEV